MKASNSTVRTPTGPSRKTVETKKVYVFDQSGSLLSDHCSVTQCAEKLKLGRSCVNAGLQRGSIVASRYYISYDAKFKLQQFNQAHNPMQGRTHHVRGNSSQSGFLAREFFDVIY